jgi:hypothetical protein
MTLNPRSDLRVLASHYDQSYWPCNRHAAIMRHIPESLLYMSLQAPNAGVIRVRPAQHDLRLLRNIYVTSIDIVVA